MRVLLLGHRINLSDKSLNQLLDLGFFVHHMLANNGIILLDLHFARHGLFVFVCRIKMTCFRRRNQADFISC